jgi:hypothetical protein
VNRVLVQVEHLGQLTDPVVPGGGAPEVVHPEKAPLEKIRKTANYILTMVIFIRGSLFSFFISRIFHHQAQLYLLPVFLIYVLYNMSSDLNSCCSLKF